jgi:hypothetical protein
MIKFILGPKRSSSAYQISTCRDTTVRSYQDQPHCITASISCLLVGWMMPGLAQLVDEGSTAVRGVVQWVCSQDGQRQQQVARAAAYCSCTASISCHALVNNTYVDSAPVVLAKQQLWGAQQPGCDAAGHQQSRKGASITNFGRAARRSCLTSSNFHPGS